MSIVAFISGLFAVAEAVPILRDALHSAISLYYAQKIAKSTKERADAIQILKDSNSVEEIQAALGRIVRARAD